MPATTITTRLQEVVPRRSGNLRENLTGDASPGVDSPAEKQEVAFWKAVLATLDKHGHDYKAAVQELRTSADMKVAELSESYADTLRRRSRMRQPSDILKTGQRSARSGASPLMEQTDPATVSRRLQTPEAYLTSLKVRGLR